ncbi:hypothetical protein DCAR_0102185 [Daucus carota subsp. sativus]|uniref:Uncharacterized protein n=1 Tax=Daucus carota subsp. sativus TaxID=79200 RepID=A0AAF1AJR5_DAUCS|nr:hypothetical protein DCAR_0102185 [Daucus carota subsp. sativus]
MNVRPYYLIFLFLFSVKQATSTHVVIGAVIDNTSRAGMETNVSLQMTIDDISRQTNPSLVLRMMNSIGEPATAALAGIGIIRKVIPKKLQTVLTLGKSNWSTSTTMLC